MVLLGAPGCGKSTLLRRLQLDDAQDGLADHGDRVSLFVSPGAHEGRAPCGMTIPNSANSPRI
jgi:GTPase SAR1 family protein